MGTESVSDRAGNESRNKPRVGLISCPRNSGGFVSLSGQTHGLLSPEEGGNRNRYKEANSHATAKSEA